MRSNLFCGATAILKRTLAHSHCVTEAKVLPCLWPGWSGKSCRSLGSTESLLKDPRPHTALLTEGLWDYVHAIPLAASLVTLTHLWASLSPEWHLYLGCESVHGSKGLWLPTSTSPFCGPHWGPSCGQLIMWCEQSDMQWWIIHKALGAAMVI